MAQSKSQMISPPLVICFGEALIDRLGPLGGEPATDSPVDDCLGGAPANVACGLARLGIPVSFIGRVGDDEFGIRLKELMIQRQVNISGLQIDHLRATRIVLVRRNEQGERYFHGFLGDCGDGFADQALDSEELIKAWPNFSTNARWLLIGSIPLANPLSAESLLWSVQKAKEKGISIALDINWRPTFWNTSFSPDRGPDQLSSSVISNLFAQVALLKVAKEEAIWFFNTDDPKKISSSLSQKPDVVVTDGPRPVRWFIANCADEMPALNPRHVVDTTGAGDSFLAGLLHQLLSVDFTQGDCPKVRQMINFASACGALVCQGAGAINPQPTELEVREFLDFSCGSIN